MPKVIEEIRHFQKLQAFPEMPRQIQKTFNDFVGVGIGGQGVKENFGIPPVVGVIKLG